MEHLPVFLDLKDRPVLVIGGGAMASRRTAMAQRAGAKVFVVAPKLSDDFDYCAPVTHIARTFNSHDIAGVSLVYIACDEDPEYETLVAEIVQAQGVFVNVADRSDISSFIMPSIIDRSPLIVAISSGGEAPIFSRMLRAKLESLIPSALGKLASLAGEYRERVKETISDTTRRRRFWEDVVNGEVSENMLSGKPSIAKSKIESLLKSALSDKDIPPQGEVYLVGSGPGDPDLLTFKALRLMQQADVVLHDRLV